MKKITKKIFAAVCSTAMLAGAAFAPALGIIKNTEINIIGSKDRFAKGQRTKDLLLLVESIFLFFARTI